MNRVVSLFIFACSYAFWSVSAWGSSARPKDQICNGAASGMEGGRAFFTRSSFLQGLLLGSITAPGMTVAFEGGVGTFCQSGLIHCSRKENCDANCYLLCLQFYPKGGLGKTKPETGVELFEASSTPIQNDKGIVSAEIKSINGKPLRIEFQTPWPLLRTTSGLEARDLRSSESAFVQVVPEVSSWQSPKTFKKLLMDSVLASQGKFGAYGTPVDIKVKPLPGDDRKGTFSVTFTSYTPAMRESERQLWIKPIVADSTIILLIVGTTKTRFPSQENSFGKILDTFLAVPAPESKLRAR
ncbi:MAG: hypothetical protein SGBAC_002826 [Bacillariaceae sp.]